MRPEALTEGSVTALRDSVAAEEVDGDVVLYDEATRAVHVLNGSAAAIVACFDGVTPLGVIASELADAFGVPLTEVREGVMQVARELGTQSLLQGVDGEVPPVDIAQGSDAASTWLVDPPSR